MMAKPVLKSLKSHSYRFVVVLLLLCTLLTFNVGRVYRVEAVATTASVVGTVLLGLGVTYIAYQTLTGANVYVPDLSDDQSYITELGRTFSQTASGRSLFKDLYNKLVADPTYSVMDFTADRLQDIYNDHKSIVDIQSDSSFDFTIDEDITPLSGYLYNFDFVSVPHMIGSYSFDYYISIGRVITPFSGPRVVYTTGNGVYSLQDSDLSSDYQYRNYRTLNGKYQMSRSLDGVNWSTGSYSYHLGFEYVDGNTHKYLLPNSDGSAYRSLDWSIPAYYVSEWDYPIFSDLPIYDASEQDYLPLVPADVNGNQITPQYPQNDNNDGSKYPLVPFVELPSTLKWGFNWRDALTDLVNGGSRLITSAWLADLINDFKNSLSGSGDDISYNYYNDGDTYYFTYYSDVVNDIFNPIYNINIEGQEDVIPVDLNTIEQYTDNVYLDSVKSSTLAFGSAIAEYFIFWHNADPVLFYTLCGSFIVILLGAFIGKWGHS